MTLPLIAQCGFHASVSSLNIVLRRWYVENLKALKLDPKTLTITTEKMCEGFLISIIYLLQWPQM